DGETVIEICMKHVQEQPQSLSERLGKPVSADLEQIVMQCLEKDPKKRPQTAHDVILELSKCQNDGKWSIQDASQWWEEQMQGQASKIQPDTQSRSSSNSVADATLIVNLSQDQ
ncbi:MAG: serine/threonine protein kinase, partial [Planctomycetaceae bacterium]|nr:serine/threonine protein kinase [Planctomycetaceae bacterium]